MKNGFTLLELLVVISIIGVLASLAIVSFRSSEAQARDAKRRSDLRQYQTALEGYANTHNGFYPSRPTLQNVSPNVCTDLSISPCVVDPRNGQNVCTGTSTCLYQYITEAGAGGGAASARRYVLSTRLENSNFYWVVCSNGQSGTVPSTTTITATCPL